MAKLTLARAEQLLEAQRKQLERASALFFRLATVRAADMVRYQNQSWDEGTAYINAELDLFRKQLGELELQP